MTCERVEELLSALIDQELDSVTSSEVEQHMRECSSCAATCRELKLLVQASAELEPINPPDRLFGDIRREIRNRQHRPRFAPLRVGWVLIPALATAVLMLVIFPRHPASARLETTPRQAMTTQPSETPEPAIAAASEASIPARSARRATRSRTASESYAVAARPATSTGSASEIRTAAVQLPAERTVLAAGAGDEVVASLRGIQQALEEIESALQRNPGNPQVLNAYHATYAKGREIQDRYAGAR
jgi:hypothetical protein